MAQPVNPAAAPAAPAATQPEQTSWETTFNTYTVGFIDTLTSGSLCNFTSCLGLKTDENLALKVIKAVSAAFAFAIALIPAGVVWAVKNAYSYCVTKPEATPVQPAAPPAGELVVNQAAAEDEAAAAANGAAAANEAAAANQPVPPAPVALLDGVAVEGNQ